MDLFNNFNILFNKRVFKILFLNIVIIAVINIIAYFSSNQINLYIFVYLLSFFILLGFILILLELFTYSYKQFKEKNYYYIGLLGLLSVFFLFKFQYLGDAFYFRTENIEHFDLYLKRDFIYVIDRALDDFKNYSGMVVVNFFNIFLPKIQSTPYYIYSFFQFIGGIYLFRLVSLFSKDKLLPVLISFLYLFVEMFFVTGQTITYVNTINSSFIIFLFYLFNLYNNKNKFSHYLLSFLFLISLRPDFFFLALAIGFCNTYLNTQKIVSLKENIIFYVCLIPYFYIINHFLFNGIYKDDGLVSVVYENNNFWYVFLDKVFGNNFADIFLTNINIIFNDKIFILLWFLSLLLLIKNLFTKQIKNLFLMSFLGLYSLGYFFIVIIMHKEGFIFSGFKYISILYIIVFVLFSLLITFFNNTYSKQKRIYINLLLVFFIFVNIWFSIGNHKKTKEYIYNNAYQGMIYSEQKKEQYSIFDKIYFDLYNENNLEGIEKYLNK